MDQSTLENFVTVRNMEQDNICGLMALNMKVNGLKTKLKDLEYISGLMDVASRVPGSKINCMAKVFTLG